MVISVVMHFDAYITTKKDTKIFADISFSITIIPTEQYIMHMENIGQLLTFHPITSLVHARLLRIVNSSPIYFGQIVVYNSFSIVAFYFHVVKCSLLV